METDGSRQKKQQVQRSGGERSPGDLGEQREGHHSLSSEGGAGKT